MEKKGSIVKKYRIIKPIISAALLALICGFIAPR